MQQRRSMFPYVRSKLTLQINVKIIHSLTKFASHSVNGWWISHLNGVNYMWTSSETSHMFCCRSHQIEVWSMCYTGISAHSYQAIAWSSHRTDLNTDVQGRSQTCVMASSAMGIKLGVFGFLPTKYAKANAKQMRPRSSPTVQRFTRIYLHAQTAVDAADIRTWWNLIILITGKIQRPPIWAQCRDKNGAGSGISSCTSVDLN